MTGLPEPKVTVFALVRDKDGNPRIDDPKNLPDEIKAMLTPAERAQLGV